MTIGEKLKSAREAMGIDERYVSEMTHVRRDFIIALEENRFEDIELADVYRIGFLRIYSQYLKLDADKIVAEYKAQLGMRSGTGGKSTFRSIASADKHASGNDSLLGDSSLENSGAPQSTSADKPRLRVLFAVVVIVVIIVAAIALLLVKTCGSSASNDAVENSDAIAETDNAQESRAYKFSVTSSVTQKVTIWEKYVGWDSEKNEPIAGAKIVNELMQANKPKTFEGHGNLCIQEDTAGGVTLRYPIKSVIEAAPAGKAVDLPTDAKSVDTLNGKAAKLWLVEIWKEPVAQ